MSFAAIAKEPAPWKKRPNLIDYEQTCSRFSWDQQARELAGLPGGHGLNMAYESIERHARGARRDHIALRWLGKDGESKDFTYGDLHILSNRFANALRGLGVEKGDAVFVLAGRIPELYISALGTLKNRSVFSPLFSAFGPEPITQRLSIGTGKVLITTEALYTRRKISELRHVLPHLQHVIVVGDRGKAPPCGTHSFYELMEAAEEEFEIQPTDPEDMALIHFTSGTTGKPKGAVHVHKAVIAHYITGKYALDF